MRVTESRPAARHRRPAGLILAFLLLIGAILASVAIGARALPPAQVWQGLTDPDAAGYAVVHQMRVPRTLLGLLAGLALGLAGAVMQALTRNPLADPGLLGVNAGASAAVVTAISLLGVTTPAGYVWFALAGAAAVAVLVWAVGGAARATPARLALAGSALNAALYAYVLAMQLLDSAALDLLRFWTVGSLASAQSATVWLLAPFVAAGVLLCAALARPLNALALGDDAARALGTRPTGTRAMAMLAVTLLCGATTAACGPIAFIGLLVPHLALTWSGPDLRWLLAYCGVLAALVLLAADVLGRVLARPSEVQVGIVTAIAGGAFFVYLLRRTRAALG